MKRKPYHTGDDDLWEDVARTVLPLNRQGTRTPKPAPAVNERGIRNSPMESVTRHPELASPPPLTGLDRRTGQRMTRGNVELDARIDLHGTGVEESRVRLLQFIRRERMGGSRTVLVITGKGDSPFARHTLHGASHFHAPERAGRLRRLAPDWFHESEFRAHVAGFQPAHPRHGGGGAFYVRLRRERGG